MINISLSVENYNLWLWPVCYFARPPTGSGTNRGGAIPQSRAWKDNNWRGVKKSNRREDEDRRRAGLTDVESQIAGERTVS